jgi:hypothetical protein
MRILPLTIQFCDISQSLMIRQKVSEILVVRQIAKDTLYYMWEQNKVL